MLLRETITGDFWGVVEALGITLLVSREYEHLLLAYSAPGGVRRRSHMTMPHPSGIAVDSDRGRVHVASTRNPNQLYELAPVTGQLERADMPAASADDRPLVPVSSQFLAGSLYLHDIAFIANALHGNAVGQNAVVRLPGGGRHTIVWWPKAAERNGRPVLDRNVLQLNSIAAGASVAESYFSASTDRPSARRPGHRNFPVDGRGVIFSGATHEPVARGLTRPHSARLHGGDLWIANSGYGEFGRIIDGRLHEPLRLPGWTRGLCFVGGVAFVATSRVIPRFRNYAPGLDVGASVCGLHAVDLQTGNVLGSVRWPFGNQVFAVESVPASTTLGFPFTTRSAPGRAKRLFYSFAVNEENTHD
jgi:uncharacterized protein (TIGR03032 family)